MLYGLGSSDAACVGIYTLRLWLSTTQYRQPTYCTNLMCSPEYIQKDSDTECIVVSSMRILSPVYGLEILLSALAMRAADLFEQ